MSAQFLQDYGEFIGRSGGRMVEDWAGVMAEALTNPWDAVAGINPFIDDDARYQAANRVMTGGRERAERTGHWLSGEYSQGALDIGESLGSRAQDLIQENDLASALVGTLEDPSLQLGLEMLPGVGGVLAKGGRIARRASQAEGAMERAFIKRNPDYLMDADTALPPGQKPLGQQMGGKQAGIIAGEKAIDNLKRSGADVMTSHGRKTGQELAEAMDAAKYMHSTGADPRDIWATTGMSLGTDDAWKWEIDDRQAVYNAPGTGVDPVQEMGPLVNVLNHPDLYKAYPKMEDIVADLDTSPGGTYYPNQFEFGREGLEDALVSKEWIQADRTSRDPRSLLLHEAQHGVQAREPGFDTGSNPTAAPPIYDEGLAESLDDWASTLASSGMDMDTMPGYVFNKNNMPMDGDDLEMTIFDQASWISKDMGWDTEAMYDAIDDHFGGGPLNTMVDSGYDSYMRSSGENEARTVQMRQDSSPAWRKEYPLDEGAPINREDRWMSEPGAREVSAWGGGGGGGNKPAKAPTYITTPTEYQKPAVPGEAIRLGPKNRKVIPETLKTQFTGRGDDFWGITETEDGSKFAATDYSGVQCTGFACAVKHKLEPGRAEVFGFDEKSNPDAGVNVAAGGHDFAVVDNRYIVDPWLSEVESGNITTHKGEKLDVGGQVVFDMKKDQELIKQIYGDQDKWKQMEVPDRPFFDESLYRAMSKPDPAYSKARKSDAPLPERAQDYPATLWPESAWDEKKLKHYASKAESPEGAALLKARSKAQKDMDKNGYTPYFDISKRFDVDPSNYTRRADTQTEERYIDQKAAATHAAAIKTPEARQRMDEAYTRAEPYAGAHDWYGMGQLEAEFVKHLGEKAGREAFRNRFSDAMATTTGGSSPKDNFTNAMYGNYLSNRGQTPPAAAFDMPSPIGGRYISGNMALYDEVANQGRVLDAEMPKRHNFSGNFEGFMDRSTIDEQMTEMATPGKKSPEGKTYGIYEELVEEMAGTKNVQPGNFQDVSWAGTKLKAEAEKAGKSSYVPQPMIETVNEAIERTSRITGQSPEEVLVEGIIKGKTPVYAHPAATVAALAAAKALEESLMDEGVQ